MSALQTLIGRRPRLALGLGAALGCIVLFGLGFAMAPRASGDAAGSVPAVPATTVRAVEPAEPLSVGTVGALGKLPVLRAPKRKAKPKPPGRSSGPIGVAPPPAVPPPPPPPVAPPPPPPPVAPPPPPSPSCIGAGCAYK